MQNNELDILIGAQIKTARRTRQFTQKELAGTIGIFYQQIQKYEKGQTPVSAAALLRLAGALEYPLLNFLRDAQAKLNGKPLVSEMASSMATLKEEKVIRKHGAVIHAIRNRKFQTQLLNLARQHNKLVEQAEGAAND